MTIYRLNSFTFKFFLSFILYHDFRKPQIKKLGITINLGEFNILTPVDLSGSIQKVPPQVSSVVVVVVVVVARKYIKV